MQRVEAEIAVSVAELEKNPGSIVSEAQDTPVALLNRDRIVAYVVSADTYEAMIDRLDDLDLIDLVKARAGEKGVPVDLDDLQA